MKIKSAFLSFSTIIISSLYAMQAIAQAATTPQQVPAGATAAAAQPSGGPAWINFALMGGIILFMWLFVFRPQSKRAKEQKRIFIFFNSRT